MKQDAGGGDRDKPDCEAEHKPNTVDKKDTGPGSDLIRPNVPPTRDCALDDWLMLCLLETWVMELSLSQALVIVVEIIVVFFLCMYFILFFNNLFMFLCVYLIS